jgi:hypothetical protein
MHCRGLWRATPESWRCPGCGRSKRGIMRWGVRKGSNAFSYGPVGWTTGLHKHHDHGPCNGGDYSGRYGRFPAVVVCGACNAIDGNIKRRLGLPASFSFSPAEIAKLVRATDNGPHLIDWDAVHAILAAAGGVGGMVRLHHQSSVAASSGLPPRAFWYTARRLRPPATRPAWSPDWFTRVS